MFLEPATLIVRVSRNSDGVCASFKLTIDVGGTTHTQRAMALFPLDQTIGVVLSKLADVPNGMTLTQLFSGFAVGARDAFEMPCCAIL